MGTSSSRPTDANEETAWAAVARAGEERRRAQDRERSDAPDSTAADSRLRTAAVPNAVRVDVRSVHVADVHVADAPDSHDRLLAFELDADAPCTVRVTTLFESGEREEHAPVAFASPGARLRSETRVRGALKAFSASIAASTEPAQVHTLVVALDPPRVLSRRLRLGESNVEVREVFGIAQQGECVVCLTARSDTIVLPCRHMCLCASCASAFALVSPLDRKCPVCRSPAASFLGVDKGGASVSS